MYVSAEEWVIGREEVEVKREISSMSCEPVRNAQTRSTAATWSGPDLAPRPRFCVTALQPALCPCRFAAPKIDIAAGQLTGDKIETKT
jgi:hypothetical protein